MIVDEKYDKSYYQRILCFLDENQCDYNRFEIQAILSYVKKDDLELIAKTDLIREIYDELGLIPDDFNIYLAFLNIIDKTFGIDDKRICEVGGGIIPRLAKRIHLKQNRGSITVYDPRLGHRVQGDSGFILKKEFFHSNTSLNNIDLLVGLMPCEGAEPLIESALANCKDFIIWLCEGGPHGDDYDFYESADEWLHSMIIYMEYAIKKKNMGKMKVLELPHFSEYPIIYNER